MHSAAPRSRTAWFQAQTRPRWDQPVGQRLADAGCKGAAGHRPGQPPGRVDVDDRGPALEGEGEHGARRVRPDPGQGLQVAQVGRDPAAVAPDHRDRGPVQVDGPAVVAEPGPRGHDRTGGSGRARGRIGNRSRNAPYRDTTRSTWVCCNITSLTRTAHGSRVRRQGRSRPCWSNQSSTACWRRTSSCRSAPPPWSPGAASRPTRGRRRRAGAGAGRRRPSTPSPCAGSSRPLRLAG